MKLTAIRRQILELIAAEGAVCRRDVARLLRGNVRTAASALAKLHEMGLITGTRISEFVLTPAGRAAIEPTPLERLRDCATGAGLTVELWSCGQCKQAATPPHDCTSRLYVGFANGAAVGVAIAAGSPRKDVAQVSEPFDTLQWRTWACPHNAVGACGGCRGAHPGRTLDTLELIARFSDGRWR